MPATEKGSVCPGKNKPAFYCRKPSAKTDISIPSATYKLQSGMCTYSHLRSGFSVLGFQTRWMLTISIAVNGNCRFSTAWLQKCSNLEKWISTYWASHKYLLVIFLKQLSLFLKIIEKPHWENYRCLHKIKARDKMKNILGYFFFLHPNAKLLIVCS